jgi:DNA-binding transcriptional LysR family regulator
MRSTHLDKLDLNLLLVFEALMKERNVTAAAWQLGLTQPTLSHALNRMRQTCGDPLFVRTPKGMQPTAFALAIEKPIFEALDLIRRSLSSGTQFDPAHSDQLFRLMMTDIGMFVFMPTLVARLRSEAPGVRIEATLVPLDQYRETLQSGECDLAVGQMPPIVAGFYQQRLLEDHYVVMVAAGHPRVRETLSLDEYLAEAHARVMLPGRPYSAVDQALQDIGRQRKLAVTVPQYAAVAPIVAASDLVATVPSRVFDAMARTAAVRQLPLPFEVPRLVVRQFWHERNHLDPGLAWLRKTIHEVVTGEAPPATDRM